MGGYMCKVFIGESEKKLGFVLYNHLYTRKKRDFTTFDLVSELKGYNLTFTPENLQSFFFFFFIKKYCLFESIIV